MVNTIAHGNNSILFIAICDFQLKIDLKVKKMRLLQNKFSNKKIGIENLLTNPDFVFMSKKCYEKTFLWNAFPNWLCPEFIMSKWKQIL
jgi:hypothetical protein